MHLARQAIHQAVVEETIRQVRASRNSRNDKAAIEPLFVCVDQLIGVVIIIHVRVTTNVVTVKTPA